MTNKKLKSEIVKELKRQNLFQSVDNLLIQELLFQYELLQAAKVDILKRGIMINVRADKNEEPFYNLNQSVTIAQRATKAIQSIMRQLHLTPQDRAKDGVDTGEVDALDQLQRLLNEN